MWRNKIRTFYDFVYYDFAIYGEVKSRRDETVCHIGRIKMPKLTIK